MNAHSFPALLSVVSRIWLQEGRDPPRLEARLSDGSYLLLGWDSDYSHANVLRAATGVDDFESIPSRECGLSGDELGALVDEVQRATSEHNSNDRSEWLSDADSYEAARHE